MLVYLSTGSMLNSAPAELFKYFILELAHNQLRFCETTAIYDLGKVKHDWSCKSQKYIYRANKIYDVPLQLLLSSGEIWILSLHGTFHWP